MIIAVARPRPRAIVASTLKTACWPPHTPRRLVSLLPPTRRLCCETETTDLLQQPRRAPAVGGRHLRELRQRIDAVAAERGRSALVDARQRHQAAVVQPARLHDHLYDLLYAMGQGEGGGCCGFTKCD